MKKLAQSLQQEGFVSIIVAMVIMIFVSLVALGFAFLARQNAIQNENRQLNTQAFYAAESAVNDAVKFFQGFAAGTVSPVDATDCNTRPGSWPSSDGTVGSTNDAVKYTCVLYDTAPTSLQYPLDTNNSRVVRVQSQNGDPLTSITISWQDSAGSQKFATTNNHYLPQISYSAAPGGDNLYANTGIVRATLIPFTGSNTLDSLTKDTQTVFLYPKAGAGAAGTASFITSDASASDPNQGIFVDGNCDKSHTPAYCNATITGLNSLVSTSTYYLRLRSLYRGSVVTITASSTSTSKTRLINEQAVVDATGKAVNVERRILVRVPLPNSNSTSHYPEYAAETADSLCKRLIVWPGNYSIADLNTSPAEPDSCKPN